MADIRSYLASQGGEDRMSERKYWLFETSEKDAIICEVWRDTRRYIGCTPDIWKLRNKSRKIEAPEIEGLCVVSEVHNKRLQNDRTSAMHLCSLPLVGGV